MEEFCCRPYAFATTEPDTSSDGGRNAGGRGSCSSTGSYGVGVVVAVTVSEGTGLASELISGSAYLLIASFIDICGATTPSSPTRNGSLAITSLFIEGLETSAQCLSGGGRLVGLSVTESMEIFSQARYALLHGSHEV